ncbi:MAG: glycosyltransferase family 2 protein [Candidatus Aenigmatarchaeota archaeon]
MKISIILPTKNQEKTIVKFINQILNGLKNLEFELIVVCNGCSDRTYEKCKKIGKKIKLVNLKESGKGLAVLKGFEFSTGNIVGFVDSDGSYGIKTIKKVLNHIIENNYDVLIGSRWKDKKFFEVKEKFERKVFSRIWSFLVNLFLNLRLKDTQAGIKFFRRKVIESINLNFITKNYAFDVELLLKIKLKHFFINEISVEPDIPSSSALSLVNVFNMLISLIKIWYNYILRKRGD